MLLSSAVFYSNLQEQLQNAEDKDTLVTKDTVSWTTNQTANNLCIDKPIESLEDLQIIARRERYSRAGQLLAMIRDQNRWDNYSHLRAGEAQRILENIEDVCPDMASEVFSLGLYESGYVDHNQRGDWRLYQPRSNNCPDDWQQTDRGCYSQHSCEPGKDYRCSPTSCSYWQIRSIYRSRPNCQASIDDNNMSIQWVCEWLTDNWPNVAAYNAGRAGSRQGRSQAYANRVYTGIELLEGQGNLDEWTYSNRRFVHGD